MQEKIYNALNINEFESIITNKPGFIKAMWCGNEACEAAIKDKYGATARLIPFEQESLSDKCVFCGGKAEKMVYWGKAY
jgi:prolyl-tRNA synthetase